MKLKEITMESDSLGLTTGITIEAEYNPWEDTDQEWLNTLYAWGCDPPLQRSHVRYGDFKSSIVVPKHYIEKVYHNAKKNTTVVLFRDPWTFGRPMKRVKVKRSNDDVDDIYMAVASAVMIHKYGTNSAFKAKIRRKLPKGFEGRPNAYQMMAAAEVSDIYESWENFCKIVDEKKEEHE